MHVMHVVAVSTCKSDLKSGILEALILDGYYLQVNETLQQADTQQTYKDFRLEEDGILIHKNKVYVPNSREIRKLILKEMHNASYPRHQGYQNTLATIRNEYFWPGMKKDIAKYIAIYIYGVLKGKG